MKTGHNSLLAALAVGASLFAGAAMAQSLAPADIKAIVASPDRSAADRTNDQRRHPEDILAFIGIKPGITALDVFAGGGYTTELLARSIGPTGKVYGQSRPRPATPAPTPAAPEGNTNPSATPSAATPPPAAAPRPSPVALADRESKLKAANIAAAPIVAVVQPVEDPVPAELADGKLDLVTLMFNYHDMGFLNVDRAAMNKAVFKALKPGGFYVIADHLGRPGTGISEFEERCTGSRRPSYARKSRPPASSWSPRATSCATLTTRATNTPPTRPCPRTSSS